jgi:lipid-binding SYLF domain-containing protein
MTTVNTTRRGFVAAAAALAAATASAPAMAQGKPDGSIEFSLFRAGFIIGGSGGSGTLVFRDHGYNLSVGGVSVGATIGVARIEFVGEVYNLKEASDIEGTYTAIGASAALAGGAGIAELQNSRGVKLRVSGRQIGLMASIDLSGMQIRLRNN